MCIIHTLIIDEKSLHRTPVLVFWESFGAQRKVVLHHYCCNSLSTSITIELRMSQTRSMANISMKVLKTPNLHYIWALRQFIIGKSALFFCCTSEIKQEDRGGLHTEMNTVTSSPRRLLSNFLALVRITTGSTLSSATLAQGLCTFLHRAIFIPPAVSGCQQSMGHT